tara:strand:+ start:3333 stop:4238 length:906 start_codon:yes stop_codon:yes gene_type:complete
MDAKRFYAHGKLMLTGEYAVLDGAKALAIPTRFGQRLEVNYLNKTSSQIDWQSYNSENELWLRAKLPNSDIESQDLDRLQQILKAVDDLNSSVFFQKNISFKTFLEFPQKWGLGSSSTLISLLAQWANIDPYKLLDKTFGGSGYDIACATAHEPIIYQNLNDQIRIENCKLSGQWTDHTYFVYLNQKKNSREAIAYYQSLSNTKEIVEAINRLTLALAVSSDVDSSIDILVEHEALMSNKLNLASVNVGLFDDFKGACKSLGAWGGDYIMVLSKEEPGYVKDYFTKKGLDTIFAFEELIWK